MRSIDEIDLAALAEELRRFFYSDPPVGYLRGKTAFRDALVQAHGCSSTQAEELVDTLEARGFLRFGGDPNRRSEADTPWDIDATRAE